jgi:hypothetical protein
MRTCDRNKTSANSTYKKLAVQFCADPPALCYGRTDTFPALAGQVVVNGNLVLPARFGSGGRNYICTESRQLLVDEERCGLHLLIF